MKNPLLGRAAAVFLMLALVAAVIGVMPENARAVTTSWLYKQVVAIKSQITALKATDVRLSKRLYTLEQWKLLVDSKDGEQFDSIALLRDRLDELESSDASQNAAIDALRTDSASAVKF